MPLQMPYATSRQIAWKLRRRHWETLRQQELSWLVCARRWRERCRCWIPKEAILGAWGWTSRPIRPDLAFLCVKFGIERSNLGVYNLFWPIPESWGTCGVKYGFNMFQHVSPIFWTSHRRRCQIRGLLCSKMWGVSIAVSRALFIPCEAPQWCLLVNKSPSNYSYKMLFAYHKHP